MKRGSFAPPIAKNPTTALAYPEKAPPKTRPQRGHGANKSVAAIAKVIRKRRSARGDQGASTDSFVATLVFYPNPPPASP